MTLRKTGVKIFNGKTYEFDSSFGFLREAEARAAYLRRQGYLVRTTEGFIKAIVSSGPTTFMIFRVWKGPKKRKR